ncbi:hypothetical protein EXIGLDRAFT_718701 [Exidia glandulosa HHB12029]|uniref:Uncharacterized protein n=1 Tax=Exidia glandulosa HHB12029 TaxID=1314781 RepID=A0A165HKH5_EXIGL|nr:hypothetical protein EXIGLDRAFT_718701 [Exidia glandulosa HHB12029]
MRVVKAMLAMVPLKLVWVRITSSKTTSTFFLLALVHCLVQIALELFAYSLNARAFDLLRAVVRAGDPTALADLDGGLAIWGDHNLTICHGVPSEETCQVVWHEQNVDGSQQTPQEANIASTSSTVSEASTSTVEASTSTLAPTTSTTSVVEAPSQPAPAAPSAVTSSSVPAPAPVETVPTESSSVSSSATETPATNSPVASVSSASEVSSTVSSTTTGTTSISSSTSAPKPTATKVVVVTVPEPAGGSELEDSDDEDSDDEDDLDDAASISSADSDDDDELGLERRFDFVEEELKPRFVDSHRKPATLGRRWVDQAALDTLTKEQVRSFVDNAKRESIHRVLDDYGVVLGVQLLDVNAANGTIFMDQTCLETLQVPVQSLRQSFRVDFTFVAFQVWVLGMSVVALLNESVPHIVAAFMTHLLATAWSGYQLQLTEAFRTEFNTLVTNGPCGANLLPMYWGPRRNTEISILALNIAVMFAIGFFSYKLLKSFGWQTFKKIGASFVINRCYRLVLAFSIAVQLSVFFIGADIALWLDQLYNGTFGRFGTHRDIFKGLYIGFLVFLFPWLAIGWFSVRRESRIWMGVFLGAAIVMVSGWAAMFADRAFLWTFRTWDFFAVITCAAAVLLGTTIALGVACRLNFGKGLPSYLKEFELGTEEPAWEPADEKYSYGDEEKLVNFPSANGDSPVPTFSAAFGGPEGLERLRTMSRPSTLASRPGISMHARGGSTSGSMDFVGGLPQRPNVAVTISRSVSASSRSTVDTPIDQPYMTHNDAQRLALTRLNTGDSQRSYNSQTSGSSASNRLQRQRWAIE